MNGFGFEDMMLITGFFLIISGAYCIMRTYHMLKIIIGMEIAMKAVTMFIILAGYLNGNIELAQSFVITVIVVEVVVAVVSAGIVVSIYKKYGSMDIRNLRKLKG
ncbi:MAG: NADH-quinone oxidoreductase subunit K [Desulfitobacteriaceae bacterium]|jgi:multicomponent Na+:H+ antiporter subunit C|nr:NADH-quinone oxidoreductase subunit K [Desulfitobacteriaceae bacterium]